MLKSRAGGLGKRKRSQHDIGTGERRGHTRVGSEKTYVKMRFARDDYLPPIGAPLHGKMIGGHGVGTLGGRTLRLVSFLAKTLEKALEVASGMTYDGPI